MLLKSYEIAFLIIGVIIGLVLGFIMAFNFISV